MRNITAGKYRKGTDYRIYFPTVPSIGRPPTRARLVQKQNAHDVLILEFDATSEIWFKHLNTGVPVQFTWSQDHRSKTWYGYVSFVTKEVAAQRRKMMQVYCIGTSFVLKDAAARVFTNSTITEAVSTICNEFGLNFIGEPHTRRFEQLSISGHSYWEWVVEQAAVIGYGVIIEGTNLIFRPIDKVINQVVSDTPVLEYNDPNAALGTQIHSRTLDYFRVLRGEHIEMDASSRAIKHVGGVDPFTAALIKSAADPKSVGENLRSNTSDVLFSEYRGDRVVHSDNDSTSTSKGHAHLSRFNLPALVKGIGDPRLRPYSPVFISGTGQLTDGYWIVKEVVHYFTRSGVYEYEMTIVTDGTGDTATSPFRASRPNTVGIIDVNHILNMDSLVLNTKTTTLHNSLIHNQSNQGFNRTPSRWKTIL